MFEKEAEEYLKKLLKRLKIKEKDLAENQPEILSWEKMNFVSLDVSNVSKAFQKGAEFGYNKANEWHDLRKNPNDLPKECKGKLYLVNIYSNSQLKFEYAEYTPTVCLWSSEWKRFEILELTVGSRIVNIRSVIAWKEIVLPKESE